MSAAEVARRGAELAWRGWQERAGLPDGPVALYLAAMDEDGVPLGAAPLLERPDWRWAQGRMMLELGRTDIRVWRQGVLASAFLVALSGEAYRPLTPVDLEVRRQVVNRGDIVTVAHASVTIVWAGAAE